MALAHTGGICVDNFCSGGASVNGTIIKAWRISATADFWDFGGLKGIPPFGQSFPHPRYSKYIATHTENTKNPKNTW